MVNAGDISIEGIMAHLEAFQAIADMNGGNRAAQYSGYNASVDYVVSVLESKTNYTVTVQPFNFDITAENTAPSFSQISPTSVSYARYLEFNTLTYTGSGNVEAPAVDGGDGCSPSSFVGFTPGNIALLARGDCDFSVKTDNAVGAGASGVLIYNYEGQGAFSGTLGSTKPIPVFGISYDLGRSFIDGGETPVLAMFSDMSVETVYTSNVIADTTTGRPDRVIVVGSHLDSVPAGPGINDNGSGSATNLELATELYRNNVTTQNKVRFAWWGAEELGLLGSEYYVSQAVESGEINNIAMNLNFDMLGSPNYFRGVYDGEGADIGIRTGCVNIEGLLTNFFDFDNLPWNLTEFTGRSDYGPFIENGIPAGGLFTGAEVIKPNDFRKEYGGLANTAFDPCYHAHCDDIYNIDQEVLISNAKAAYYALTSTAENLALDFWLTNPR
eukprot:CAMPEP_0117075546 /NCGR_PEP_ID=MMETSP0472-20121206/53265_1 /TAXON_ID=693140 ORGANISM="Tiarina fusus, Strain LIS" /NCGR_SAMPLE_ID=MMETSP0472 /ASSEMBLY_ACC=CAM_ASM_000603 /LENGTH=441 /DNA_ID=CAMNT_0004801101 /DNA_START=90 /DNA_END=1415 /DNA_ORIENTATION=+